MIETLEKKNAALSELEESAASQDLSSVPIGAVRQELEATKANLADALAKLEDDDIVVVKWEGASLLHLVCLLVSVQSYNPHYLCSLLSKQSVLLGWSQRLRI